MAKKAKTKSSISANEKLEQFLAEIQQELSLAEQSRLLAYYTDLQTQTLAPEVIWEAIQELLEQFRDEIHYLTPELQAHLAFMSEASRRRFTQEIKRLAAMAPLERDSYLHHNADFKTTQLYLGATPLMEEALELLGLSYPASLQEIKQAYRLKAKSFHPDQGGEEGDFMKVHQAYAVALTSLS